MIIEDDVAATTPLRNSSSGTARRIVRLLGRRLLQLIPTLFGLSLITFLLVRLLPGGPAKALAGVRATPEVTAQVNEQLGLDQSLPAQYVTYLSRLLRGDLGTSFISGASVNSIIGTHLSITIMLVAYAVALAVLLGIPLAVLAAYRRGTTTDRAIRGSVVVVFAFPTFWVGIVLIAVFGIQLGWFPTGGAGAGFGRLVNLFLPALCLAVTFLAVLVRSLRASLIETIDADFVSAARLKGIPAYQLLSAHILRPSLIPFVALIGLNMSYLLGTSVVVENVFALNGIGQQLIGAVLQRDFLVVQGIVLCFGILVVAVGLVVDILQALLDPRTLGVVQG
ncbi:ABC transporter permease [Mycobacterium antarcticum]|uniref:ABC transporter permease n=1 Tax=Mycolicibacterium sp. TUM20984 TaxID=3023368 RepID=UPI00239D0DCC|nr:ABC transporter permease [Mycolicibacterium sp. TUM20984]GLP83019.1 ABC transporter permease [Mycolicibacterium sp. TUM20984]